MNPYTHNVSELSLPDLGDHRRDLTRGDGFPVRHQPEQRDRYGTKLRVHRARPETHQNLINTDKEQNRQPPRRGTGGYHWR